MKYETLVIEPLRDMAGTIGGFIPTLLTAVGILVVGWIAALFVRRALTHVLDAIGFDKLANQLHATEFLRKGGIRRKPSDAFGCVVYSVSMIMVLLMTVKALGFAVATGLIDKLLGYVPSVITGAAVLIIGMYIARFVSVLVYMAAKNTDMPIPAVLARLSRIAIMVYVGILYLKEVGFVTLFEGVHYTIFIGGVVFALALSFGLAGRDVAAKYLDVLKATKTPAHK